MKKKKFILKNKITNSLMFNGRKETCEKIIKSSLKQIQRKTEKNYKKILQLFIINLTPMLKFNKLSKKRGKKKKVLFTPFLISNNELRINFGLKLLKTTLLKNKKNNTVNNLTHEIINFYLFDKSETIEKKTDLQKKILSQKRYFYKFRWYKL